MNVEEFLSAHCDKLINNVRVRMTAMLHMLSEFSQNKSNCCSALCVAFGLLQDDMDGVIKLIQQDATLVKEELLGKFEGGVRC